VRFNELKYTYHHFRSKTEKSAGSYFGLPTLYLVSGQVRSVSRRNVVFGLNRHACFGVSLICKGLGRLTVKAIC